ncbi:MAG TPA: hemerythrin family protein [Geobacteraceae bacterium]
MLVAKWSERYSVNIEEMDGQHKKLLNLLNGLYEAIKRNKDDKLVAAVVTDLNDCVALHFREEEKLMEGMGYPHLDAHKSQHLHFMVQFHMMNSAYQSGHLELVQIFVQYLKNWFVFHMFSEDRTYGAFLESRKTPVSSKPLKAGNF